MPSRELNGDLREGRKEGGNVATELVVFCQNIRNSYTGLGNHSWKAITLPLPFLWYSSLLLLLGHDGRDVHTLGTNAIAIDIAHRISS